MDNYCGYAMIACSKSASLPFSNEPRLAHAMLTMLELYYIVIRSRSTMATIATAIRFAPEERSWIQSYADFCGKTFSDVVREAVLEKLEDAVDIEAYRAALEEDDGVRYSSEDVMEMALAAE